MKTADTKKSNPGCFPFVLSIFPIAIGILWLLMGEIDIPSKGIHITGLAGKFISLLWISFWGCLIWVGIKKMKNSGRPRAGQPKCPRLELKDSGEDK